MRTFDWVEKAPEVPEINALCESANDAYKELEIHPLIYMAYKAGNLNAYEKAFYDHCNLLFEEAQKISETSNIDKKAYLLKLFRKKLNKENGTHVKFFNEVFKDV